MVIRPDIVDGALAVVVDPSRPALAVWKGRDHIDLHDPSGVWHEVAPPLPFDARSDLERDAVIAHAARALEATEPPAPATADVAATGTTVLIDVDDLQGAWMVRARPWGYALWDGGQNVDLFAADGTHRRTVPVASADLSTLSHLMLDLLALIRREENVPSAHR